MDGKNNILIYHPTSLPPRNTTKSLTYITNPPPPRLPLTTSPPSHSPIPRRRRNQRPRIKQIDPPLRRPRRQSIPIHALVQDALLRRRLQRVVARTQPLEGRDGRVAFADGGLAQEFEAVFWCACSVSRGWKSGEECGAEGHGAGGGEFGDVWWGGMRGRGKKTYRRACSVPAGRGPSCWGSSVLCRTICGSVSVFIPNVISFLGTQFEYFVLEGR